MSDSGVPAKLGEREYRLQPQRIGRIRHSITAILGVFSDDSPQEIDDQLVEFFRVFIPDLEPKWRLLGYASEEAMQKGEYDPAADQSPTPVEIADTIEAIFTIHGGQRLVRLLKGLIDPAILRETITREMKIYQRRRLLSSLSSEDGPASTSSSPTLPTPEMRQETDEPPTAPFPPANGASHSLVS